MKVYIPDNIFSVMLGHFPVFHGWTNTKKRIFKSVLLKDATQCLWWVLNQRPLVVKQGFRFFFNIGGPKWPIEQKMVGHFLKWWAQAYQTKHSWHLGSILYLHTDTCKHICILLAADYTVKPILSVHSKKKTNYRLMQVKSIAECSRSILQSFRLTLRYHLLLRYLFCLFLKCCLVLKTGFTVLTTYMYFLFYGFRRFAVRWIFLLKWDFFTTKKDGSTGPPALESDDSYYENIGQWPVPTINLKACSSLPPHY